MASRWVAVIIAAIAVALMVLSFFTPWYAYNIDSPIGGGTTNCWVTGTCSSGSNSADISGDAKDIYDACLALMIIALVLGGLFLFLLLWKSFKGKQPGGPNLRLGLAVFAALFVLGAVLTFAIGLPEKTDSGGFWRSQELLGVKATQGPSAGWYFAVITIPVLAVAAFFAR